MAVFEAIHNGSPDYKEGENGDMVFVSFEGDIVNGDAVEVEVERGSFTGKDIMLGKTYTEAECKALLNKDLATVARQINPYIKVDIPETTRGALYSFVYNVGAGNFRTSTLLRKINQGDIKGACDQLRRWTYAGGKQWKGLMTRREIEREVCLWGKQ